MRRPRLNGDANSDTYPFAPRGLGLGKVVGLVALIVALVFGLAPVAEAHTDFEASYPTDGAVIADPVAAISIRFTAESLVAGDGFLVLTPTGEIVSPEVTISTDQREFTLLFDPPLADGVVGVQWSVRAGDAHPIEGSFSFTTTAPASFIEPEPPAEIVDDAASEVGELESDAAPESDGVATIEPDAAPDSDVAAPFEPSDAQPESDAAATLDPAEAQVQTAVVPESAAPAPIETDPLVVPGTEGGDAAIVETKTAIENNNATGQVAVGAATISMDDFLAVNDSSSLAGPIGFAGRLASQAGSLIAIGVAAFAVLVSRQSQDELRLFVHLVRQAGVLTVVGALIESVGLVASLGSVSDALLGSAGVAVLLRLAGAAGLIVSIGALATADTSIVRAASREQHFVSAGGAFSGSINGPEDHPAVAVPRPLGRDAAVAFNSSAWLFVGLLALSYVFDGHAVTKGNRLLTGLIDLVHVGGGAVWLGGLVCLLALSRSSRAQFDPSRFIDSVVRFSVVAAVSLGAVGIAGLALTVTILDSVSELWSTAWGRLLIAKVLTVAIAIGAGAFNHFVLVPELQSISAHDDARESFVRTLKIEVAALAAALLVTAALVAAAS